MAKKSAVEKNKSRMKLAAKYEARRKALRSEIRNADTPAEQRYLAVAKLAELPRNGAKIRTRLRCALSGRPRGNYRKFQLSRIALRELGSAGLIPGLTKASW